MRIVRDLKNFSRAGDDQKWQRSDLHAGLASTLNIVQNELKFGDSGQGIAPENLKRIVDPIYRRQRPSGCRPLSWQKNRGNAAARPAHRSNRS